MISTTVVLVQRECFLANGAFQVIDRTPQPKKADVLKDVIPNNHNTSDVDPNLSNGVKSVMLINQFSTSGI